MASGNANANANAGVYILLPTSAIYSWKKQHRRVTRSNCTSDNGNIVYCLHSGALVKPAQDSLLIPSERLQNADLTIRCVRVIQDVLGRRWPSAAHLCPSIGAKLGSLPAILFSLLWTPTEASFGNNVCVIPPFRLLPRDPRSRVGGRRDAARLMSEGRRGSPR